MIKNCFANKRGECSVMRDGKCAGICAFYKTKDKHEKDTKSLYDRLAGLPNVHQRYIAETYYGGDQPWNIGRGRLV